MRVTVHGPAGSMRGIRATAFPQHQTRQRRDVLPRVQRARQPRRSTRRAKRRRSSASSFASKRFKNRPSPHFVEPSFVS